MLFYDIIRVDSDYETDKAISCWIDESNTQNLLKPIVFEIFRNVKEIEIRASCYPFSLLILLSRIQNTSVNKVVIKGHGDIWSSLASKLSFDKIMTYGDRDIRSILESRSSFKSIVNRFKENEFEIKIDDHDEDKLVICKI